jgi:hypothetical protein
MNDVAFILDDVWNARSALSKSVGLTDRLVLLRWDQSKPAAFGNIVCLTKRESRVHAKLSSSEWSSHYSPEFLDYVQSRFIKEAQYLKLAVII